MKNLFYLFSLFIISILSCMLEPHFSIEKTGFCYDGYEEFRENALNNKIKATILRQLPDTLFIDSSVQTDTLKFVFSMDTALFKYSTYELLVEKEDVGFSYVINEDTLNYEPLHNYSYIDYRRISHDNQDIIYMDFAEPSDITEHIFTINNPTANVTSSSDTFDIEFTWHDTIPQNEVFSNNDIPKKTTLITRIELKIRLERLVNDEYCSDVTLFVSKPILLICRSNNE